MGIKEERERMFADLSPLRSHSMNQAAMKRSLHGERTMRNVLGEPDEISTLPREVTTIDFPLTEQFLEICFDEMVGVADRRVNTPDGEIAIPGRTFYLLNDVKEIYKFAVQNGLKDIVIPRPMYDLAFITRLDYLRYPGLISRQNLFVTVIKLPGWNQIERSVQTQLFSNFYKAFEINLASCDFSLEGRDSVIERLSTYGFILENASKLSYVLMGSHPKNKVVVTTLLDNVQKGLKFRQ